MEKKLRPFYTKIMNCDCTKKQCPEAWKDFSRGVVPRGFHIEKRKNVKILVVGKNPGHPLKLGHIKDEVDYYKGKRGRKLLRAKDKFTKDLTNVVNISNNKSLIYRKNIRRYLRFFLGMSKKLEPFQEYQNLYNENYEKKLLKHVGFTNLFKCSTRNEQQKLNFNTLKPCYEKFLSMNWNC